MTSLNDLKLAVIGLGYVGLPLACAFGRHEPVVGFDIDAKRVRQLQAGSDISGEVTSAELAGAGNLTITDESAALATCNVFIVTVPTPVDEHKRPDLSPLITASRAIGELLTPGAVVIYESTVYPGATEEMCIPALQAASGMTLNDDFGVGYSPERINPGDREHGLAAVPRITAGSNAATADFVDALYARVVPAGTHQVSALKVAEAAKVIENTQRDANIALINEFALIFHHLGIDTTEVLQAAGTKWNFLPFRPGLVGGHCISVDPYYLIQKAQSVGYYPDILLSCRRINDTMGEHVASQIIKLMIAKGQVIKDSRILILGFTFKPDCADIRNTRVIDLVHELHGFGVCVDIHDPWADADQAKAEYDVDLLSQAPAGGSYDGVVLAVAHAEFKAADSGQICSLGHDRAVIYDIKGVLPADVVDGRL